MAQACSETPPCWFALQVRSNRERAVFARLQLERACEAYLPVFREIKRWSDRTKLNFRPVFPGYVFVRTNEAGLRAAQRTIGVWNVLREPIPDGDIAAVRKLVASRTVRPARRGELVEVRRGPFAGILGTVASVKGSLRLVLNVERRGSAARIEVDSDDVRNAA